MWNIILHLVVDNYAVSALFWFLVGSGAGLYIRPIAKKIEAHFDPEQSPGGVKSGHNQTEEMDGGSDSVSPHYAHTHSDVRW